MGQGIKFDLTKTAPFIEKGELELIAAQVKQAHQTLKQKTGAGSDCLGCFNNARELRTVVTQR
jgi:glucose-6-phosphate isomerase